MVKARTLEAQAARKFTEPWSGQFLNLPKNSIKKKKTTNNIISWNKEFLKSQTDINLKIKLFLVGWISFICHVALCLSHLAMSQWKHHSMDQLWSLGPRLETTDIYYLVKPESDGEF